MNKKGLSPVVAAIVLIAVTIAVSIAVAAWMGSVTFTYMGEEPTKSKINVYQIGENICRTHSGQNIEFAGILQVDGTTYMVIGREVYKGGYTGYVKIFENAIVQFYENQQFKVLEFGDSWIKLEII